MELSKPTISNTTMTSANTEYSYAFPAGTRAFRIKLRDLNALLKIAFVSGQSGSTYITVPYGDYLEMRAKVGGSTIYFQSPAAAQTAEIKTWK